MRKPFGSISVTKRCLTINETNYNFANGSEWKLECLTADLSNKVAIEIDEGLEAELDEGIEKITMP